MMLGGGLTLVFLWPPIGRLSPPALLEAGPRVADYSLERLPPGTEKVAVELASGERLRGVFVPSDRGAPVVLHFLESSGSITSPLLLGYHDLLADLADAGFASLVLDYRGIGASDGSRSVAHLAEDVEAMWDEAVRRAGDPDLVVLRGLSLGALGVGLALNQGAEPAGIELVAPVRAQSAVRHFAAYTFAEPAAWLAALVFRPVAQVDLAIELERSRAPLLVVAPESDFLLPETERAPLERLVASRGRWVAVDEDHFGAVADAHGSLLAAESDFLGGLFRDWPDVAARTHALLARLPPELAAACEQDEGAQSRLRVLARLAPRACPGIAAAVTALDLPLERVQGIASGHRDGCLPGGQDGSAEDWIALLDPWDPAGPLPHERLTLFLPASPCTLYGTPRPPVGAGWACIDALIAHVQVAEEAVALGSDGGAAIVPARPGSVNVFDLGVFWRELREERRLGALDARRQIVRMLLKGERIPERLVTRPEGVGLEAKECGVWRPVDLDWPIPTPWVDEPDPSGTPWRPRER